MRTVQSISGCAIRLSAERWGHIQEQHPELRGMLEAILSAVEQPDLVLAGNQGEFLGAKSVDPQKWLVVAYREDQVDGFVITAFLTRRWRSLAKRRIVWQASM